jgi:hypothetical protein
MGENALALFGIPDPRPAAAEARADALTPAD